ncbi:MAG: dienelactone hydrolase family protein, partial [Pseudomonadota bacterium]
GYSAEEVEHARSYIGKIDWDATMSDDEAAVDSVRSVGTVAVVGYCLGVTLAFMAATRIDGISAAIGYYGGKIASVADEVPRCPTQLHFGAEDHGIPLTC